MMQARPRPRLVIAGGGTAGWMAAALFAYFAHATHDVVLVESDAIGTIGVGEATIPQIRLFNDGLGIDERAFLRATGGTFKLGIEFVGWGAADARYMHAFGAIGRDAGFLPFHQYWLRARRAGHARDLAAYSLNEQTARAGRMQAGRADMPYAFHFDAGLYARFLRDFAEARGARRIEGEIVAVERDGASGDVTALTLADGATVAGDLFLDCTGFRARLIGDALGVGYHDWTQWLPCDRAIAIPTARVGDPIPYTRATAHGAGWQWRIPLQHRTGNGVVYSSAFWADDDALATLRDHLDGDPLAEPNRLRFTTGRRQVAWSHNVVAVGLAAGFMEPLESTSIHLVQTALTRLLKFLPGSGPVAPADRDAFNRQTATEYARIRDFLILHYKATTRADTPFWRHCAAMAVPDTLRDRIALWAANGHLVREDDELFTEVAWLQVLAGQGIVPAGHHPLVDAVPPQELETYMHTIETAIHRAVDPMPGHAALIARECAMTVAA